MIHRSSRLLAGASTFALALTFAGAAFAQSEIQEVVVTATRITASGYEAPTPTTILGAEEIARQGQSNIFSAVNTLPSLMGSTGTTVGNTTTSAGNTGLSSFGIHGLGTIRTLTLLDGQRVVPAYNTGVTDISQFPQLLIERVDVVTGGASASYGSDAVAGVVNFVTNKRFTGFKANALTGISTYGDNKSATLQAAGGTAFAGGRGHVTVSGEYSIEKGVNEGYTGVGCESGRNDRCWYQARALLQRTIAGTPAGQPQFIATDNAQPIQFGRFGLITAGPLRGIAFGPGGQPYQYQYGSPQIGAFAIGGQQDANVGAGTTLAAPLRRANLYTRLSYDITPKTNVWTTVMWSEVDTRNVPTIHAFRPANLTIQCDNAFLAQSVRDACVANNITSFQFGTANGNIPVNQTVRNDRVLWRFVAGADGRFDLGGKEWTWNTYFQHGENDTTVRVSNIWLNNYYNAAIDAVMGPNGTIVCRNPVARAQGCVPLNALGDNKPSDGALAWLYPDTPFQVTDERQEVFAFTLNGEPFSLWAGPVSIATGFEWREEAYKVKGDPRGDGGTTDPLLDPNGNNWYAGNFHSAVGKYSVREAFIEAAIPLFDNAAWGNADLSLAGRATHYSTSGSVETWKVGLTWDTPLDGLKFRGLRSRDIRAPNLGELFAAEIVRNGNVNNPFTGTADAVFDIARGNTELVPERSLNTQFGVVYQPEWLPGFQASVDYYRIHVKDIIGSLGGQTIVELCQQGFQPQCDAIITDPPGRDPRTTPFLSVINQAFNLASVKTDGFDIEASYQFTLEDLVPGRFTIRGLATNVASYKTDTGIPGRAVLDSAGMNAGSTPDWKLMAMQTYDNDRWSVTLTERWISDGVLNSNYIECQSGCPLPTSNYPTINDNHMDGAFYVDLGGSYRVNDAWQAYFKIDNLLNKEPEQIAFTSPTGLRVNPALYDIVGRMYRLGFRVAY
jgi:iron complex outermembrane receptor protein